MSKSKFLSLLYHFILLIFFVSSIIYWSKNMIDGEQGTSRLDSIFLALSTACLVFYCFTLGLSYFKKINLKNIIFKICLWWIFLMPIVLTYNEPVIVDYFKTILWPLLFIAEFVILKISQKNIKRLKYVFFFSWILGLFFFLKSKGFSVGEEQTNTIYYAFLQLPLFLCLKKEKYKIIILLFFSILVIFSLKRSCIFAIFLTWGLYYICRILKSKNTKKVISIFFIAIAIAFSFMAFNKIDSLMGGAVTERINRKEENTGKNRLAIYAVTERMIEKSSLDHLILGHGNFAVKQDSPLNISAHNDFLEIIYDYGILIFLLYLGLWYYIINKVIFIYRLNSPYLLSYLCSISIFILLSAVSHLVLYSSYFNLLILYWAYIEYLYPKSNSIKKRVKI